MKFPLVRAEKILITRISAAISPIFSERTLHLKIDTFPFSVLFIYIVPQVFKDETGVTPSVFRRFCGEEYRYAGPEHS
jgi:hypothetical protein